ncbi:DNA ligase D [Paraburkholderia saeva]|uniref:DNA ligase D n=1 Tax=Paraburkholderia saeva TaxID=2777537 RepID=UPI001D690CEB|nr:DNA ligase D [Paraburkholderia saeva]CAG4892055.1 Multifunctional non-homologous end joining protein LigD [Paraburkholderia saeva]CAG4895269.1 Multifunctional non-homologous end joining protein LigD [Paraburkholderia saeva]
MTDRLDTYTRKRRFDETPEPSGVPAKKRASAKTSTQRRTHALSYVIQEHDARRLHYDFRLELDGALLSWAVPKGPSLDPSVKRLAVHVEDHPLEYGSFEGTIPEGNYGAGDVIVWDRGTWEPAEGEAHAREAYKAGKLKFELHGEKLHGGWMLVRSHMRGSGDKEQWLLIKERDAEARDESAYDVLKKMPGSVLDVNRRGASKKKTPATKKAVAKKRSTAASSKKTDIVATRSAKSLRELAATPAIEGAKKATLPASLKPQLATLVDTAPPGDEWLYEIKFDGYRVLARIDHRANREAPVKIFTRAGNDWTSKFRQQADALAKLDIESAWLDGEAVVLDNNDVPSFQLLQNAFDANRAQDITVYFFDVPFLNGYDLRGVPLVQRRAILKALLEPLKHNVLRYSDDFGFSADALLKSACDMALEGIIGKRRDSLYGAGRTSSWVKLKCRRRQEFVVGGYTGPAGSRAAFGALLLGVYDAHGKLQYAGRVGTGFDAATLRSVKKELDALETQRMPFANAPRERSRTPVHWVRPELVAECNFAEWTTEQIVRQASFVSLRRDKPARQIVREAPRKGAEVEQSSGEAVSSASTPKKRAARQTGSELAAGTAPAKPTTKRATKSAAAKAGETSVAGVRVSHPDRVIDKSTGTRKIDLVRYYESVARWMLPHLEDRPVSLVRAPEDIGGELFFQKHSQKLSIPNVTQHPGLDPEHPPLITIESVEALVGAAQMGTIELHTWNAVASNIEKPDRVVFDLDPDPSLGWDKMIEAALLTRSLLEELGLASFCKTSGGKGFHVVVPLAKQAGWDEVKAFSQAIAQHMATTLPTHFAAKMGAQNRKKKIFVDYLRNNRGSSTVAAFSARARPGLGVSVPLAWDEVPATQAGDQWTIANLHERLDALKTDPWAGYAKTRQRITAAMKKRLDEAGSV